MVRREWHVDAAKVLASNFIVLHHLTAYGPVADGWDIAATAFTDWIFEYGRMAVQVFLVIGGYLAAAALAPEGTLTQKNPWRGMARRYLRLVLPLVVALLLTVLCSSLVRPWLTGDFVPGAPDLPQLMAHIALLQGFTNVDALSVGLWYVAMDFQLYCLMGLILWVGGRYAAWGVASIAMASLFYFNRHESGELWATYFFGAYGMGALAWWGQQSAQPRRWLAILLTLGLSALAWDFRIRIAIALVTALALLVVPWYQRKHMQTPLLPSWLRHATSTLARSAYALFLVHFSVLLLGNAIYVQLPQDTPAASMWVVVPAIWLCSLATSLVFERWVERPLSGVRL
jgi:peptidoglycan/LPS O-acetylase OafA/YrhL